ncbi:MAG: ABC transporter ATP-binding protein [Phycisphaerales bacterium]|nr:MAG: ABC transporter ATP-binding protein [Phycisphaerales bacterium]
MAEHALHDDHYSGRFDPKLWMRIVRHTLPYRWLIAGMGLSGLIIAAVEISIPILTARLVDGAIAGADRSLLVNLAFVYAFCIAVFCACVLWFIVMAGRIATGIAYDLRRGSFDRLQELSFSYYDTRPVGWLVSRLTSDCDKISRIIPWFSLDVVWGSCMLVGISIAMLMLHWPLGLTVLLIVPPLVLVTAYFQRRLLSSSRQIRRTNSQITASYSEELMGVKTTKSLVREEANLGEFQRLSDTMHECSMRNRLQSAIYLPAVIVLGSVGAGLALWKGGVEVAKPGGGALSVGELIAFMQFTGLFAMPIQDLAARFTDLQSGQAAAERIQSLLDTEPEISDSPEVQSAIGAHASSDRADDPALAEDGLPAKIDRVEFRRVWFEYKPGEPVLKDFSLTVDAGHTVALVGQTGGGKSTIVSLAARFYEPTRGEILIDGVDYRKRSLRWLQSSLGVVQQTPHLFSGTVGDNIRYGRLDATDEDLVQAAKAANAWGFIERLEGGLSFEVGEGGQRLSTGQRQLVSLSRALLADPQIVIMDEATSSVDTETERLVQDAIETLLQGRIAFVIAHRLSTIRSADTILVINEGVITERGTHDELMAKRGRYFSLYRNQFAREHWRR